MDDYVTNEAWRGRAVRADAIDEIADQFERPDADAAQFWVGADTRWPPAPRPWNVEHRRAGLRAAS